MSRRSCRRLDDVRQAGWNAPSLFQKEEVNMPSPNDEELKEHAPGAPALGNGRAADGQTDHQPPQKMGWVSAKFHQREDADSARHWLIAERIASRDSLVEAPTRSPDAGWKGGFVDPSKKNHHFIDTHDNQFWKDLKTGLITGGTAGLLVGLIAGLLAWVMDRTYDLPGWFSSLPDHPFGLLIGGIFTGLIASGLVVWIVRLWLAWFSAKLHAEETMLIVHCEEEKLPAVSEALMRAHAYELHISPGVTT
jgi:hypothetical protein